MKHLVVLAAACLACLALPTPAKDISSELVEIVRLAKTHYPSRPIAEAMQTVAQERAGAQDAVFKNVGQLANAVADTYSMYLHVNTDTYVGYCLKQGVDIAPYARRFTARHAAEAEAAAIIYARLNTDFESIWVDMKASAEQTAENNLGRVAKPLGVAPADVCKRMAEAPDASAETLSFAAMFPELNQLLLSFRK